MFDRFWWTGTRGCSKAVRIEKHVNTISTGYKELFEIDSISRQTISNFMTLYIIF